VIDFKFSAQKEQIRIKKFEYKIEEFMQEKGR